MFRLPAAIIIDQRAAMNNLVIDYMLVQLHYKNNENVRNERMGELN